MEDTGLLPQQSSHTRLISATSTHSSYSSLATPVNNDSTITIHHQPHTQRVVTATRKTIVNKCIRLVAACVITAIVLAIVHLKELNEWKCLGMLVFVSAAWALEIMPLFATGLLVPFLATTLDILKNPITHTPLDATQSIKFITAQMFDQVILLLLGGFTIASALEKHGLTKRAAEIVLAQVGNSHGKYMSAGVKLTLASMGIANFASMWISNIAAPVLTFTVIRPILTALPIGDPLSKALILGVALAANIGGMGTPIASPQNAIALGLDGVEISWGQWLLISLPVSIASIAIICAYLSYLYKSSTVPATITAGHTRITMHQYYVLGVTILTVILWCLEPLYVSTVGGMGTVSLIPMFLFFFAGTLTKHDFNHFSWNVVFLAMGGIALGKACKNSGLLDTIGNAVTSITAGWHIWLVTLFLSAVVLVLATIISHSVTASIALPLVASMKFPGHSTSVLVMMITLMCSCGMGLPISGFPNITAIALENAEGKPYISTRDFIRAGIPSSILAFFVCMTLGYGMCIAASL